MDFNEEEIKKFYKKINYELDELEYQMYFELKNEYGISEEPNINKLKKAIKDFKCDRQNIKKWIENVLIDI